MAKQKKFKAMLIDEVNEITEHAFDAYKTHIASPDTIEAWGLNSRQQFKDELTGKYYQVIDPRDYRPVRIFSNMDVDGDKDVESDVTVIASQTEDEEMTLLDREDRKDNRVLWLGIGLAGVILCLLIAILMSFKNKNPEVINAALRIAIAFI